MSNDQLKINNKHVKNAMANTSLWYQLITLISIKDTIKLIDKKRFLVIDYNMSSKYLSIII